MTCSSTPLGPDPSSPGDESGWNPANAKYEVAAIDGNFGAQSQTLSACCLLLRTVRYLSARKAGFPSRDYRMGQVCDLLGLPTLSFSFAIPITSHPPRTSFLSH